MVSSPHLFFPAAVPTMMYVKVVYNFYEPKAAPKATLAVGSAFSHQRVLSPEACEEISTRDIYLGNLER